LKTGKLNSTISIYELSTATDASGDITETWTLTATVRANVTQLDGSRFINVSELVDKVIYKIVTWNNSYGHNLKILYKDLTLYPMRPPTINGDRSGRDVITIYGITKQ
jgi:hypothetical protein